MSRPGGVRWAIVVAGVLICAAPAPPAAEQRRPCADSSNIPLPDLTRPYRGLEPGLFAGGRTTPSPEHAKVGLAQAARVRPLDASGRPATDGRVLLLSIGMSNTSAEFGRFAQQARAHPALHDRLTIVNGALSGADAAMWADPASRPWQQLSTALRGGRAGAGSAAQVQVIWMKQAHLRTEPFPAEIQNFSRNLETILQTASRTFPNLRVVYVSSRTRSGAESRRGPGEPQAYESGFAVRRLVEARASQTAAGAGDAPWVSWGPYLWATARPRSDGASWGCGDLQSDLLHPSESGNDKVAAQLLSFFMTEPTAVPWFLEPDRRAAVAPAITTTADAGAAPLAVEFAAAASPGARHFWGFGDGTTSIAATPRKTFHVPGAYDVRLTVTDATGGWATSSVRINVGGGASPRPLMAPRGSAR